MTPLLRILLAPIAAPFATIKLGPVVSDARGSVGGTVFSRGPFGAYIKARVAPTNPNTDRQAAARALMTNVVTEWMNVLTTAQRDVWNASVQTFTVPNRIGDPVQLTGLQFYVRTNALMSLTNQAFVTIPPVVPIAPAPTLTHTHAAATGIQVSAIGNWDNTVIHRLLFQHSTNLALPKNFWKGPWLAPEVLAGSAFSALPLTVAASAELAINSRVFLKYRCVHSTGSSSFPVIYSQDIGDPV